MKFINKDKKALTLIEVMVFFVVASVLLMLTLPAMTQKKSNNVCIPGGYVIFDGSKVVKGDTQGVVKVNCSTRWADGAEICEYVWRAPTNEVYITSVGGGGGGSGAMRFSENEGFFCEYIIAKYLKDYCEAHPGVSGCDGASVDYTNFPDVDLYPNGTVRSYTAWRNPNSPMDFDNSVNHYICKTEALTTPKQQNVSPLCNVDLASKDYAEELGGDAFGIGPGYDDRKLKGSILDTLKELYPNKSNRDSIAENVYNKLVLDSSDKYIDSTTGKCKTETLPINTPPVNKVRVCSIDDQGEDNPGGVANCKSLPTGLVPIYPTPDYHILNGAGGSGGYYTFGANFDPSFVSDKTLANPDRQRRAYEEYVENIAKPVLLKKGDLYKIKVGQGGLGGKTMDPYVGVEKYGEFDDNGIFINNNSSVSGNRALTTDGLNGISGKSGEASCIITNRSANVCNCGSMYDFNCASSVFAVAAGGQGAFGTYNNRYDEGYFVSVINKDDTVIDTYFTAPWVGNPYVGPFSTSNQIYNLNLTPPDSFMEQDVSNTAAVRPNDCGNTNMKCEKYDSVLGSLSRMGYPPQSLGLPGSVLAPGKGGPSLYGIDRPGAGGDGGYYKWRNPAAETNKNLRNSVGIKESDRIESKGRDGLIEIRWFTTCE